MANKNIPQLRFAGFDVDWKECSIYDVANRRKVINLGLKETNLLSLSYGKIKRKDINQKTGLLPASYETYQIVDKGTIVFRFTDLQNDQKSLRVGLSNERGIVSSAYVCVDGDIEKVLPNFFYWLLHYYDTQKVFYKMGAGIRQSINAEDLTELIVKFPALEEQSVLSSECDRIDRLIIKQQEKCEQLLKLKSALLDKLFPKAENLKPELRLNGFKKPWIVVRLRDVANKSLVKNSYNEIKTVFTNSAEFGIIKQSDFFDKSIANRDNINGYYIVDNYCFVYNPRISSEAPVGPINLNKTGEKGVVSPLYLVFSTQNISAYFLEYYFKTSLWHKYMWFNGGIGARGDRFSIKTEVFFDMPLYIPSDLEEQKSIAEILQNMDKLIELNNLKLSKLRDLKSAMLDKLFV